LQVLVAAERCKLGNRLDQIFHFESYVVKLGGHFLVKSAHILRELQKVGAFLSVAFNDLSIVDGFFEEAESLSNELADFQHEIVGLVDGCLLLGLKSFIGSF